MSAPTSQALAYDPSTSSPTVVIPVSAISGWVVAIAAGGLEVLDSSSPGLPLRDLSTVTDSSRRTLTRTDYDGTTLRVCMAYHMEDLKPDEPLTIRVFGKKGTGSSGDDFYVVLRNLNGDASVPIITDPSSDPILDNLQSVTSEHYITQPDNNAHSWDCDGCNNLLIVVERTYQPTGMNADASLAYLLAKVV